VAVQSEVQWVTVNAVADPPSGTFRLCEPSMFTGGCTAAIAFDASASAVASAVNVAYDTTPGSPVPTVVSVVGGPTSEDYTGTPPNVGYLIPSTWYYRVMWVGGTPGNNYPTMTIDPSVSGTLTNATVQVDGYRDGSTAFTQVSPHGGYSAVTDYCLQCHQVHDAPGEYALLAQTSVTATCATCHSLYGAAKPGTQVDGFNGLGDPMVEGTTSERAAYEVPGAEVLSGHEIGWEPSVDEPTIPFGSITVITESGWEYRGKTNSAVATDRLFSESEPAEAGTASETAGGLYCGSCHTPHGEFGQLINSYQFRTGADEDPTHTLGTGSLNDVEAWANNAAFFSGGTLRYLWYDADPTAVTPEPGVWLSCSGTNPTANAGAIDGASGACAYLTATDTEGESAYLYGYKLLSGYPNHSWRGGGLGDAAFQRAPAGNGNLDGAQNGPESWGMDYQTHDQQRWCGRCHDLTVDSHYGGISNTHGTSCTACHGNPNDGTSTDFPHTSTFEMLMKDYPDLLCISCHNGPTYSGGQITTPGSLP
jgi:predicted CXXCH cytochrome family protein